MSSPERTDADVARQIGVTPSTLRRWVDNGVVPKDGAWTPAAVAHARIVARLRERGHTLRQIAAATEAGRLSFAYIEDLLPAEAGGGLFHFYVHEPLMRDGVPGLEMAEEMWGLAGELLPLASPIMDHVHQRFLQHFVEQDVIGHMETDLADESGDLGRLRVAIAFADLAGYT